MPRNGLPRLGEGFEYLLARSLVVVLPLQFEGPLEWLFGLLCRLLSICPSLVLFAALLELVQLLLGHGHLRMFARSGCFRFYYAWLRVAQFE